jgi:outer membrane lipoprotein-sorting protein
VSLAFLSMVFVPVTTLRAANSGEIAANVPHATTDAKSLIDAMQRSAAELDEYKYECEILSKKGNKTIREYGTFYFKKPKSIRVEVSAGPKNGSVAVLRPDGKVRGHLGGFLKYFVTNISPESSLLTSTTGHSLVRSDYNTLANELQSYLRAGWRAELVRTANGGACILDMKAPGNKQSKRITVDEKTMLPVEWENTSSGKIQSLCKFKNVVVNPGLSPTLFKI